MKRINHIGATGSRAYDQGLMLAAHYGARASVRYDIWVTPATGQGRKLTESDPLHREAMKAIRAEGGLEIGQKASWSDAAGNSFVARRT